MSKKKTPTEKPVTTTTETAPAEAPKNELTANEKKRIRDAKYRAAKRSKAKKEAKKPDENEKILASLLLIGVKVIAAISIINRITKRDKINDLDIFILKEAEKVLNDALDIQYVKEAK